MSYRVISRGKAYRVIKDSYEPERKTKWLNQAEVRALGFFPTWSVLEARAWAKQLSLQDREARLEKRRQGIALKLLAVNKAKTLNLGPYWPAFKEYWMRRIDSKKASTQLNALPRLIELLAKDGLKPTDWGLNQPTVYRALLKLNYSLDYSQRLLTTLNEWGFFLCRQLQETYVPVRPPKGVAKERIRDNQKRRESGPLTPEALLHAKQYFSEPQYNWLQISVWFGLRPHEIVPIFIRIGQVAGRRCVIVYQPKLVSLPKERRNKVIPILFPEQEEVLKAVIAGNYERPIAKTVKKYLGCTLYGGRKNFVKLMQDKGRKLFEISAWMGHQSVDRTRRVYAEPLKLIIGE